MRHTAVDLIESEIEAEGSEWMEMARIIQENDEKWSQRLECIARDSPGSPTQVDNFPQLLQMLWAEATEENLQKPQSRH